MCGAGDQPNRKQLHISKTTTLTLYNSAADIKVSEDASSLGIGAMLRGGKLVETRGLCIKDNVGHRETIRPNREGSPCFWACKKFAQYILGKSFVIETDPKLLGPLLGTKNMDSMSPRILRSRLRLDRFQFSTGHVPGKELYTADALSRAPTWKSDESEEEAEFLVEPLASKQGQTGGVQNCTVGRPHLLERGELLSEWLA